MKHKNIQIIGIPEGEQKEQWIENLCEKMTENFPKLVREKKITQIQEAEGPNQDEP